MRRLTYHLMRDVMRRLPHCTWRRHHGVNLTTTFHRKRHCLSSRACAEKVARPVRSRPTNATHPVTTTRLKNPTSCDHAPEDVEYCIDLLTYFICTLIPSVYLWLFLCHVGRGCTLIMWCLYRLSTSLCVWRHTVIVTLQRHCRRHIWRWHLVTLQCDVRRLNYCCIVTVQIVIV